jgi:heme exporter protein A
MPCGRIWRAAGIALIATHIDLGLEARVIDVSGFRAAAAQGGAFDEAFA